MMVKLEDICEILDSRRVPIAATKRQPGPYPYYGANGVQDYIADYIFDDDLVLLAEDGGNFGSKDKPIAYRVSGKCWVNNHAHVLKPKEKLDVDYLCYSLMFYDVSRLVNGATRQKLTQSDMKLIEIPLPTLDEQRKIAAVLDKVSDLIAKRRQQLDKLDEMVKARFVEMFGDFADPKCEYERCKLVDACVNSDDIKCGPFGTQLKKEEYQKYGVALWEIPQINSSFKKMPVHFLTEEKAKQLNAYSLIPGDIAMSRKGNVGRCALFPEDYPHGIIHSDVLRIRVDIKKVDPCFMMHQFHISRSIKHQIEMVSSGAIMSGINVAKLKQIDVYIPPLIMQQQFTHFTDKLNQISNTLNQSLDKLETLKKALMQEYFREDAK